MSDYAVGAIALLIVLNALGIAGVVFGGSKDARRRRAAGKGGRA